MAERLGIVLYWTGCILAGSWMLLMLYLVSRENSTVTVLTLAVTFLPALVLWLLGKGLRFIFSGK